MGRQDTQTRILNTLVGANRIVGMKSLEISTVNGDPSGTYHDHLIDLQRQGLIQGRWEDEDFPGEFGAARPVPSGSPRERYYRLTPQPNEDSL